MDKLLNGIEDFSTIAKYFEIINQTTDDFLFIHDMATDKVRFFGKIGDYFEIDGENGVPRTFQELGNVDADVIIGNNKKKELPEILERFFRERARN